MPGSYPPWKKGDLQLSGCFQSAYLKANFLQTDHYDLIKQTMRVKIITNSGLQ